MRENSEQNQPMNTPQTAVETHTPGPWKTNANAAGDIWIQGDGGFIAEITPARGDVPKQLVAAREANARLIAAAPDLREALAALYEWALANCDETRLLMQSEAALAKAEGRTP